MIRTPIRLGTARRLGIRRPDSPPGSVLTWQGRLTDTEAEEIRARFTAVMGAISVHNLRPINLQGSQLPPDRCHGVPLCHLPAGHDGPHRWKAADGTEMIMGWAGPAPANPNPGTPPRWEQVPQPWERQ